MNAKYDTLQKDITSIFNTSTSQQTLFHLRSLLRTHPALRRRLMGCFEQCLKNKREISKEIWKSVILLFCINLDKHKMDKILDWCCSIYRGGDFLNFLVECFEIEYKNTISFGDESRKELIFKQVTSRISKLNQEELQITKSYVLQESLSNNAKRAIKYLE